MPEHLHSPREGGISHYKVTSSLKCHIHKNEILVLSGKQNLMSQLGCTLQSVFHLGDGVA